MTKRIDWEREQLRQKIAKNLEFDHKWRSSIQESGEWRPLRTSDKPKGVIDSLSRRHQREMRRIEALARLRSITERMAHSHGALPEDALQALTTEARNLVTEIAAVRLSDLERRIVSRARAAFGENAMPVIPGVPTAHQLLLFARSVEGHPLRTLHRGKPFTVALVGEKLEITPDSGKARTTNVSRVGEVLSKLEKTGSFKPGDYVRLTYNASYVLTLVNLWQQEEGPKLQGPA